jgi:hypothetical protein
MLGGMYLWALFGYELPDGPVAVGASLSLPGAMRAAEGSLSDPRGFVAAIKEVAVQLNVAGLDDRYAACGGRWLGRRTTTGAVRWDYRYGDPDPAEMYYIPDSMYRQALAELRSRPETEDAPPPGRTPR